MGSQILDDAQKFLFLHNTMRKDMQEGRVPVIVRGEGNYVFDEEGKRYLDLVAGNTRPNGIGYGREEVAKAMYEQAKTLHYYTPAFYVTPTAVELAKKLASLYPGDLRVTCLVCDGSEAVESAFKIAKQYHYFANKQRRFKIISRQMAYHGQTMGALSALGYLNHMRNIVAPLVPGHAFLIPPYCYRCPLNLTYPACDLACADALDSLIQFEGPDLVAAFIAETFMQGMGALPAPEGYFERIRKICDQYGVLLIIDEVICGFGRTGKMFGIEHYQVKPDIMTMAKMLTGGYAPLGAAATTPKNCRTDPHLPAPPHLRQPSRLLRGGFGQPGNHRAGKVGSQRRGDGPAFPERLEGYRKTASHRRGSPRGGTLVRAGDCSGQEEKDPVPGPGKRNRAAHHRGTQAGGHLPGDSSFYRIRPAPHPIPVRGGRRTERPRPGPFRSGEEVWILKDLLTAERAENAEKNRGISRNK